MIKSLINWLLDHFFTVLLILMLTLGPVFSPDFSHDDKVGWILTVFCVTALGIVITVWGKWRQKAP